MAVIAIDLGGTKLAAALLTSRGRVEHRTVAPLDRRRGKAVGKLICLATRALLDVASVKRMRITGVGVCVPGISDRRSGRVWAPNIPGWTNYPLRRELSASLSGHRIPVAIDSDRACSILGESWRGAARGCRDAIFLSVGTGIGAGIMVDGRILRGPLGIAGAIGWLALDRPFRREYVGCGCFEYHASGRALAKVARAFRRTDILPVPDIFSDYHRGDPGARAVIAQAIEFWGMAVANLVSLFNPRKIIFGGGVFGPALEFLDLIRLEAHKWAQPVAIRHVIFEGTRLEGDAALYGAGYLALRTAKEIH
ncbi:MAG TPA: ROK family protein [Verrucomicrobiae bacterium]